MTAPVTPTGPANEYRHRTEGGKVEVRTMPITREQMHALGALASIAERLAGSYEVYGGIRVVDALAHFYAVNAAWFDARHIARDEEASR